MKTYKDMTFEEIRAMGPDWSPPLKEILDDLSEAIRNDQLSPEDRGELARMSKEFLAFEGRGA
jgi:hypothetical protein